MENRFQMSWDENEIAKAFRIKPADVREYMTDGRRVSFIIERRLMWDHSGWRLAPNEGAGYDLIDPSDEKWEVRSVTNNGVYFTPSNQVGKGRYFNESEFQAKLSEIKGFILTDIMCFPLMEVYKFPVKNVIRWHDQNYLRKDASVSRKKFLETLVPDIIF